MNLSQFINRLTKCFNKEELFNELAYPLNIEEEELIWPDKTRLSLAKAITYHCVQSDLIEDLIDILAVIRPLHSPWCLDDPLIQKYDFLDKLSLGFGLIFVFEPARQENGIFQLKTIVTNFGLVNINNLLLFLYFPEESIPKETSRFGQETSIDGKFYRQKIYQNFALNQNSGYQITVPILPNLAGVFSSLGIREHTEFIQNYGELEIIWKLQIDNKSFFEGTKKYSDILVSNHHI